VIAGLIGAVGVALAVLTAVASLDPIGIVAGLAGAVSMAAGLVLTKRWGRPGVSLLTATGWQLTAGGLLLVPIMLLGEGLPASLTGESLLGYGYLSLIGTALAYTLWFRGLDRLPAARVSLLSLLSPVTATVIGWAALGQSLTPVQVTGMVVAFGAVVLGQSSMRAPAPGPHPAAAGSGDVDVDEGHRGIRPGERAHHGDREVAGDPGVHRLARPTGGRSSTRA
jgi:probable blue pigment (indigoidine) exporter